MNPKLSDFTRHFVGNVQRDIKYKKVVQNPVVNKVTVSTFEIFEKIDNLIIHSTSRRGKVSYPFNIAELVSELESQCENLSDDFRLIIKARAQPATSYKSTGKKEISPKNAEDDDYSSDEDVAAPLREQRFRRRSWLSDVWKREKLQTIKGWSADLEVHGKYIDEDHLIFSKNMERSRVKPAVSGAASSSMPKSPVDNVSQTVPQFKAQIGDNAFMKQIGKTMDVSVQLKADPRNVEQGMVTLKETKTTNVKFNSDAVSVPSDHSVFEAIFLPIFCAVPFSEFPYLPMSPLG